MENEQPINQEQHIGYALTSFILSFFGLICSISLVLCVPGMVLGIIGLSYAFKCQDVTRKPFVAFKRISRPFSIVAIIVGAIVTTAIVITLLVLGIIAIVKYVR